jgi:hypothetical protein
VQAGTLVAPTTFPSPTIGTVSNAGAFVGPNPQDEPITFGSLGSINTLLGAWTVGGSLGSDFPAIVSLKFLLCPARLRTFHPTHCFNSQSLGPERSPSNTVSELARSSRDSFPDGLGSFNRSRMTVSLGS